MEKTAECLGRFEEVRQHHVLAKLIQSLPEQEIAAQTSAERRSTLEMICDQKRTQADRLVSYAPIVSRRLHLRPTTQPGNQAQRLIKVNVLTIVERLADLSQHKAYISSADY